MGLQSVCTNFSQSACDLAGKDGKAGNRWFARENYHELNGLLLRVIGGERELIFVVIGQITNL